MVPSQLNSRKRGLLFQVWYTIYHHLLVVKGVNLQTPLFSSTNQWEFGTPSNGLTLMGLANSTRPGKLTVCELENGHRNSGFTH